MFSRKTAQVSLLFCACIGLQMFIFSSAEAKKTFGECKEENKQYCHGECIERNDLCILEPVPGTKGNIRSTEGIGFFGVFMEYVNAGVWKWALSIGIAIALLNGTYGGLLIVLSNGNTTTIDLGKTRFIGSAIGLIVLLLAGVILQFINPIGFIRS